MADNQKVIATAGLISVAVGSANAMVKYKRPPSTRFLIGSGMAYLILSAMGASDTLGELGKGLALGIMTTIILGEGGGVMSYFVGPAEGDTTAPKKQAAADREKASREAPRLISHHSNPKGAYRSDMVPAQPFFPGR